MCWVATISMEWPLLPATGLPLAPQWGGGGRGGWNRGKGRIRMGLRWGRRSISAGKGAAGVWGYEHDLRPQVSKVACKSIFFKMFQKLFQPKNQLATQWWVLIHSLENAVINDFLKQTLL